MFAEAKQWHQLTQFRLRRLDKVNIQALFTAAGQNIKRLLKPSGFIRPPQPTPTTLVAFGQTARLFLSTFA